MDSVDITDAKQNLSELIDEINNKFTHITIVNSQGKNAVLISEKKWKNIEETLYLSSIPGLVNDINNIRKNENWKSTKKFNQDEEW